MGAPNFSKLITMFKNVENSGFQNQKKDAFEIYSAFRFLSNFTPTKYKDSVSELQSREFYRQQFQQLENQKNKTNASNSSLILSNEAQSDFFQNSTTRDFNLLSESEQVLTQKQLREAYKGNKFSKKTRGRNQANNYLNMMSQGGAFNPNLGGSNPSEFTQQEAYMEYRNSYRKQTEQTFQDEESKKVFMIINSFGGSVGNGITVHDALQFIKAGSMTLALGVAASAASLALAGGTIGERYVTEGCHVMIHQPEGGLTGQASDIWIDSQEIMKIRLDVAEIYSLSTYRPRHKILRDLDRDCYLTATETVYYGLADEIATNEVMHEIIEMTTKVWDYHESAQQRLLESRESAANGLDTQTQS
jgi:ATP-dependent Clp protease protease subunit